MLQILDKDQQRVVDRMFADDAPNVFVIWWKQGLGKTRVALYTFRHSGYKDLIVVCRRISFEDWMDEMELCGMDFLVYCDDYLPSSICKLSHDKNPQRVLLLSAGDLKNIPANFPKSQMLVVDELYLFANAKSKRSKLLRQMSLFCSARIGLSGTIMPARDNLAVFGQLHALNAHQPLASGTTEFQSRFQIASKGKYGRVYVNKPSADAQITARIADRVDINFPKQRPTRKQIIKLSKTPDQAKAILKLKSKYEWNNREYKYALQIVHVVNGISNGWFVGEAGDLSYYKSTKVEYLLALLDDIVASGERIVVWCAYHNDISRIAEELKHPWLEFTARVSFPVERWESGKYPIVLATEANGASVNHFKHVKNAIYFSINYKLLDLEQSMARHERKGSEHDGAYYRFLQTRGTNDARAHQLVTESKQSEEDLVKTLASEIFK